MDKMHFDPQNAKICKHIIRKGLTRISGCTDAGRVCTRTGCVTSTWRSLKKSCTGSCRKYTILHSCQGKTLWSCPRSVSDLAQGRRNRGQDHSNGLGQDQSVLPWQLCRIVVHTWPTSQTTSLDNSPTAHPPNNSAQSRQDRIKVRFKVVIVKRRTTCYEL